MNIFYLSHCPEKAAQYQYNKHVVKMILETAQLLCTAHVILDGDEANVPYKPTHKNHPSAVWVRSSAENYMWAYEHMLALGAEYTRRYKKTHLTILKCRDVLYTFPKAIDYKSFAQPPQCMPDEYKSECSVDAYWNYYENEKHTVKNNNEELITRP
jgi:predicted ATP-dependent endonuclease of OLD family